MICDPYGPIPTEEGGRPSGASSRAIAPFSVASDTHSSIVFDTRRRGLRPSIRGFAANQGEAERVFPTASPHSRLTPGKGGGRGGAFTPPGGFFNNSVCSPCAPPRMTNAGADLPSGPCSTSRAFPRICASRAGRAFRYGGEASGPSTEAERADSLPPGRRPGGPLRGKTRCGPNLTSRLFPRTGARRRNGPGAGGKRWIRNS